MTGRILKVRNLVTESAGGGYREGLQHSFGGTMMTTSALMSTQWISCLDKRFSMVKIQFVYILLLRRQEYRTEEDVDTVFVIFRVCCIGEW